MKEVMTVDEMRAVLGIGRNKAYDLIREGDVGCVRAGKKILIPRAAVENFLKKALVNEI